MVIWLYYIVSFILAAVLFFYLPGKYLSDKFKFKHNFLENIFFSLTFGIVVFTLLSYYFSWTGYWLIAPVLILLVSFNQINKKINKFKPRFLYTNFLKLLKKNSNRNNFLIFTVLFVSAVIFSLTTLTSGEFVNNLKLEGVNAIDSLWHISLINELKVHFPPDNPGMAGIPLKGYHFFYNFLLAKISTLSFISPTALYFQFFPLLTSFLWACGVYVFVKAWSRKTSAALLSIFLTMFGGSFGFVLWMMGHKGYSLDSVFGILQPVSSLINPPFSISVVILLGYLFALTRYYKTKNSLYLIPLALFTGSITLFKVYAGMILISASTVFCLFELYKKNILPLLSMLFAAIILSTTFLLFSTSSGLVYYPLWAPDDIMKSNLPWWGFAEKQYTYNRLSVIRGLIYIESVALFVFIFGNLGIRSIGLISTFITFIKKRKKPSPVSFIIFSMLMCSIIVPLFFIQTIKAFEIIQMAWYFLFFSSLFAAIGFSIILGLLKNNYLKAIVIILIILSSVPGLFEQLKNYVGNKANMIDQNTYGLVTKLRSYPYDYTLLEIPSLAISTQSSKLEMWYKGSNPFFLAFGNKRGYLENEYIEFPGLDRQNRYGIYSDLSKLNKENDSIELTHKVINEFKNYNIKIIISTERLLGLENKKIIKFIFSSDMQFMYEVY